MPEFIVTEKIPSGEAPGSDPAAGPGEGSRSSSDRSLRARQAAYTLHSRHDSRDLTKAARGKFLDRFLDEVDPNRVLPEAERERRAMYARKAYMTSLARKSAAARSSRKGER